MPSSEQNCRSRLPPAGDGDGGCNSRHSHCRSKQRLSVCQFLRSHILLVVMNHAPLVGGGRAALACGGAQWTNGGVLALVLQAVLPQATPGVVASSMQCAAFQLQCGTTFNLQVAHPLQLAGRRRPTAATGAARAAAPGRCPLVAGRLSQHPAGCQPAPASDQVGLQEPYRALARAGSSPK